jgi:hypothetical protein
MGEKNYITIYKCKEIKPNSHNYYFSVKNEWFLTPFSIFVTDEKITFKRIGLDYEGKNIHVSAYIKYGWSTFGHNNELLKHGSFYIDEEESNEDIKVIYWEDERIKD